MSERANLRNELNENIITKPKYFTEEELRKIRESQSTPEGRRGALYPLTDDERQEIRAGHYEEVLKKRKATT